MNKKLLLIFSLIYFAGPLFSQTAANNTLEVFSAQSGQVVSVPVDNSLQSIEGNIPQRTPGARPKCIVGTEDWEQRDPDQFPYSATVLLMTEKGVGICSGAMVGDYTVLTAAHCVLKDPDHNNGELNDPHAIQAFVGGINTGMQANVVNIFIPDEIRHVSWGPSFTPHDYAIVVLDRPFGRQAGYFGVEKATVAERDNIVVLGFPAGHDYRRPWYSPGKVMRVGNGRFYHTADALPGNSGGPILKACNLNNIIGIHTFEDTFSHQNGSTYPVGQELISFVANYRDEAPTPQQEAANLPTVPTQQLPQELLGRLQHDPGNPIQTPQPADVNAPATGPQNSIQLPPEAAALIREGLRKKQ